MINESLRAYMFFSLPYEYEPAGLFSIWHFLLLAAVLALVAVALYASRHMSDRAVRRTVRVITGLLWVLELAKIAFVLFVTGSRNPNDFIPLYYCSLILYAGIFSSCFRGLLRRVGDCFIATGGLVGGLVFLLMPTTSLPRYPAFHFISWHSFLLHGLMIYLGLLLLVRGTYRIQLRDIRYCAALVSIMCMLALVFNTVYDHISGNALANLMFVSKDFPGTPITVLYRLCGPFFTVFMWLVQSFGPFLFVYWMSLLFKKIKRIV